MLANKFIFILFSSGVGGNTYVKGEVRSSGKAELQGRLPVVGLSRFSGEVPAKGSVTITAQFKCGSLLDHHNKVQNK
jgi:hypothetical protein